MLTLDTAKARAADNKASVINETGKYIGVITRAEKLISTQGTSGLGLSFKSDDGGSANYLDIWMHKENGEELYGAKTVNALLACLRMRGAEEGRVEFEAWDKASGGMVKRQAPGYPALMGKRIGLLLQQTKESDKDGKDRDGIAIYAVFQADTELTASEILDSKTVPEKLPKMLQALMLKPVRDNRRASGAKPPQQGSSSSGFAGMDDDCPFANPYRGIRCHVI